MTAARPAIFDSHLHIIDKRFPLYENRGYVPEAFDVDAYKRRVAGLDLRGGAIVSGSFQGFDQTYLQYALNELGPDFVGVSQLPADTPDETLLKLHGDGVRGVRFNLRRGGSEDISRLTHFAWRIFELANWHVELYIDSVDLPDLFETLCSLPFVSIDHLGLSKAGFNTLLKLAERGVKVKATGFGRLDFDPVPALRAIYAANPRALMFGTDLPSTRAPRPFAISDIDLIQANFDSAAAENILFRNARHFYFKRRCGC